MKIALLLCSLWSVMGFAAAPEKSKEAERPRPVIVSVFAPAWVITGTAIDPVPASPKVALTVKAVLKTGEGGEIKVRLADGHEFTVRSATEVEIPTIGWDRGEVSRVLLKQGEVRWSGQASADLSFQSSLFELPVPAGDFLFRFQPSVPEASVRVFDGQIDFSQSNGEEIKTVRSGEMLSFRGVLEDGEVAADVLLKGKRIPRGQLGPVQKMPPSDWQIYQNEIKAREKQAAEVKRAAEAKKERVRRSGVICAKPAAKFNECAWTCEGASAKSKKCPLERSGVRCIRQRCNANGLWAEKSELSADEAALACQTGGTTVGACP